MNRFLGTIPAPIFGNGAALGRIVARYFPVVAPAIKWALPLSVGGLWFVWPAVDDEFKIQIGMMKPPADPEDAGKPPPPLTWDASAQSAIAGAYVEKPELDDAAKEVYAQIRAGDFSQIEKEWDETMLRISSPGDGDDSDDDDDDDEDEDDDDEDDDDDDDEDEE